MGFFHQNVPSMNNSNSNENGSSVKTDAPKKRNKLLKDRCVAYCIRTGFMTKEGEIMRSIFFHSDTNAEIDFDTIKFLLVLMFFAILEWVNSRRSDVNRRPIGGDSCQLEVD